MSVLNPAARFPREPGPASSLSPLRERVAHEVGRERGATLPDDALPSPDPRSREAHPPPQRGEGSAPHAVPSAAGPARDRSSFAARALRNLKTPALALALPLALALVWHLATVGKPYSLIPPPADVWTEMRDLAVGGIYDDAFSGTLLTHLLGLDAPRLSAASRSRRPLALPLGLLIGRVPLVRAAARPDPADPAAGAGDGVAAAGDDPVRARAESAFFLVFLGAFYPILLNTIFGVRSVEPRLFEAAAMLGCPGTAQFSKVVLPAALPSIFTGLRLGLGFAWVVIVVGEMTGVPTGPGRGHHGGAPAVAHRDRDLRA